jgi:DNA-binding MarR family transcriptional regulator
MSKTDFDALTRLTLAAFRAHQAIVADGDRLAGAWRMNSAKWKTLGAIALAAAPITAPDIGRSMGLTRQAAQKQLDALMAGGLVARAANERDARAPLYRLTAKGERVYGELIEAWRARSAQLGRGLDARALEDAARILQQLVDAIAANPQSVPRRRKP